MQRLLSLFHRHKPRASPEELSRELPMHIDQLIEATTDGERAAWLLACPQMLLAKNQTEIRWALRKVKFELGISYLAVEISALNSRRHADGGHRRAMHRLLGRLRHDLFVVAGAGGGEA